MSKTTTTPPAGNAPETNEEKQSGTNADSKSGDSSAPPPLDPPTEDKDARGSKKVKLVRVRSKGERFRRAGIEFTREGVEVDVSKLTAKQIAAINDEPSLVVDGGELAAPEKKAAK